MEEAVDLAVALAAVGAVEPRFHTASEEELLADVVQVERIGRVVDGLRLRAAAELEHRSRPLLGEQRLSFRSGARDGVELLQLTAQIDHAEARRRIGLGTALAPRVDLLGGLLPGRHQVIADALLAGEIGVDAARIIVNTWKAMVRRVVEPDLDELTRRLVATARTTDPAGLQEAAALWSLALDPDGVEPKERTQRRKRALRIGRTLEDGTTRLTMILTAEDLAIIRELLQSRRRSVQLVRTEPGSEATGDDLGPEWREERGPDPEQDDPRTRGQQDHDTAMEAFGLAARAEQEGVGGTAITHTVVITATVDDVLARKGQGWTPGVMAGLPIPVIERTVCTGETRLQVTGPKGEVLFLSRAQRMFTPAQRLALVASSGGRCQYPGCRVPHPYLEAHHAEWWARDGGSTDIGNGLLLCSYHHHLIHAKDGPVEIRRHDGDFWVVPKSWSGLPRPEHRLQTGPPGDPRRRAA
jgi:hypothetical protein